MNFSNAIRTSRISGLGNQLAEVRRLIDSTRPASSSDQIVLQTPMGVLVSEDPLRKRRNRLGGSGGKVVPRWG